MHVFSSIDDTTVVIVNSAILKPDTFWRLWYALAKLVLCAGVAGVLPELRRFFRRRSRILYAGAQSYVFPAPAK